MKKVLLSAILALTLSNATIVCIPMSDAKGQDEFVNEICQEAYSQEEINEYMSHKGAYIVEKPLYQKGVGAIKGWCKTIERKYNMSYSECYSQNMKTRANWLNTLGR